MKRLKLDCMKAHLVVEQKGLQLLVLHDQAIALDVWEIFIKRIRGMVCMYLRNHTINRGKTLAVKYLQF